MRCRERMTFNRAASLVLLLVLALASGPVWSVTERQALVIGNADYAVGRLKNPLNDARDMAAKLKGAGFQVTRLLDADKRGMEQAIRSFTRKLTEHSVGLFYFAGHGIEVEGENYLVPIGADIASETDVKYEAVNAGRVLDGMKAAGNGLNLVVLDACRNNPWARGFRSANRGLARMAPASGSLILYATEPGQVAADGPGRNGVFTRELLVALGEPGLSAEQVFKRTAQRVRRATGGKQSPWMEGVILGQFYFVPAPPGAPAAPVVPGGVTPLQIELAAWNAAVQCGTEACIRAYLDQYPRGQFAAIAKARLQSQVSEPALIPFTVKTVPEGARVRILNIGPKYRDGMELAPGRYRIEVSAPGYKTHYGWHELSQGAPVYVAELERLPEQVAPSVTAAVSGGAGPAAPASSPRAGQTWREPLTGMELAWVPGGCYQMGSNSGDDDEKPAHEVCVDGFWLGRTEVTVSQWRKLKGSNPSKFKRGDDHPVEQVSWNDVQDYIGRLNGRSRERFRLPTEAEWEYACRSGGKAETYSGSDNASRVAWYGEDWDRGHHAVKGKAPNGLGLYDMSGNVWEWVEDVYDSDAYGRHARNNPENTSGGSNRVYRGGSWFVGAGGARCAYRFYGVSGLRGYSLGFRLLRISN